MHFQEQRSPLKLQKIKYSDLQGFKILREASESRRHQMGEVLEACSSMTD